MKTLVDFSNELTNNFSEYSNLDGLNDWVNSDRFSPTFRFKFKSELLFNCRLTYYFLRSNDSNGNQIVVESDGKRFLEMNITSYFQHDYVQDSWMFGLDEFQNEIQIANQIAAASIVMRTFLLNKIYILESTYE